MFCMSLQLKAIGVKHMTYHPSTESFLLDRLLHGELASFEWNNQFSFSD